MVYAFDLDGTLTNKNKEITPVTHKKIQELLENKNIIVLASGRPLIGVLPLAKHLHLDEKGGYIVCLNGAVVYDCKSETYIFNNELPKRFIEPVIKYSRQVNIASLTYNKIGIVTEKPEDKYVGVESYNNQIPIEFTSDLINYINYPINKIMFVGEPDKIMSFFEDIRGKFGELNIYRSDPYFLEIMNKGVDKKYALIKLLKHLNMDRNKLIAFGDGLNDIPMLELAAKSIVMSNGNEEVKKIADYITLSNDSDGIYHALLKIEKGEI
jgi:Cof subfamily protein (haloacid dehalogenase superfamily)